jgi:hypothetical protein
MFGLSIWLCICVQKLCFLQKWFSQEILLELVEKQQIIVCFNKPSTVNTFYNHDLGDQFLCDTNEL